MSELSSHDPTVFCRSPFSSKTSEEGGAVAVSEVIDWSRQALKKRKLMQAANENNQTQITDYYSILVRIQSLTNKDKKLSAMLQNLSSQEADVEELNFEVHHIKC